MTDDHLAYVAFFTVLAIMLAFAVTPARSDTGRQQKAHAIVWAWAAESDKPSIN